MNETSNFFDELADDPDDRSLAAVLRSWRDDTRDPAVAADERMQARFAHEPASPQPARWRRWMQRPAIAFAASFVAVLILGAGAFALVARDSGADDIDSAASTTSSSVAALAEVDDEPGQITLPGDLSDQTGYASCIFNELSAWFTGGFSSDEAPHLIDSCGVPPIPDLGPEAEAFQSDLQAWTVCVAGEFDALLPELPDLIKSAHDDPDAFADIENDCGEPPDPRDYGLELPFADFDWESFDPGRLEGLLDGFDFGEFDLDGFDLDNLNLEELLGNLPEGFLPEDFDAEEWKSHFGEFDFEDFRFDFEACDPEDVPDFGALADPGVDFKTWFEEFDGKKLCGFAGLLDLENLNLDDLDLEQLFSDLEMKFGGFEGFGDLEGLQDLDIEQLFDDLFGDLELDAMFDEGIGQDA